MSSGRIMAVQSWEPIPPSRMSAPRRAAEQGDGNDSDAVTRRSRLMRDKSSTIPSPNPNKDQNQTPNIGPSNATSKDASITIAKT